MNKVYVLLIVLCSITMIYGQTFTEIDVGIIAGGNSIEWGDYDNDGDQDIVIIGKTSLGRITKVYKNIEDSLFYDIGPQIIGVAPGSVAWGDYDNDGDLDILLTGNTGTSYISRIYKNRGSDVFSYDLNAVLIGVDGSAIWGDYDNDGDLDILLAGQSSSLTITKVYKNIGSGRFVETNINLSGVKFCSLCWFDYDNDSDLDILLTGDNNSSYISKIYRNDSGVFTDIIAGLVGVFRSSVSVGDYDNDSDLDIIISGTSSSGKITKIYNNNRGSFYDIGANLLAVSSSKSVWGDFDNDGDLDIALCGSDSLNIRNSKIYRNDSGIFNDINAGLMGVVGSTSWGDYDNDDDLDLILNGYSDAGYFSKLYKNNSIIHNTKPTIPTNLTTEVSDSTITFSWDKATDNETPQEGLSYNLYIGKESLSGDLNSPMSSIDTGYRKIVNIGNAQQNTSYFLKKALLNGTYYWSVQAVDHAFSGSEFASEMFFTLNNLYPPIAADASDITKTGFKANWEEVAEADGYIIDIAGDENFTNIVSGYENLDIGNTLACVVNGLSAFTDYFYRVRAYDTSGRLSLNSNVISVKTLNNLYPPIALAASDIKMTSFKANWESVDVADGYFIDVAIDELFTNCLTGYENLDIGDTLACVVNGLSAFTDYFYRVRAYNYSEPTSFNSNIIFIKTLNNLSPPIALAASDITITSFKANWKAVDVVDGYFIDVAKDELYTNCLTGYENLDIGDTLTCEVNGLSAFTKYYYRVRAYNYSEPTSFNSNNILVKTASDQFTDIEAGLVGEAWSSVDWGDYDNDGDLDIIQAGVNAGVLSSKIYRNDLGNFVDIEAGLGGVYFGTSSWFDYDNDGDLDLLLTGDAVTTGSSYISKIYSNDSGVFTDIEAGMIGVDRSSVDCGDYDNDGDIDIILTGMSLTGIVSIIYRNDRGNFIDINASLPPVCWSSVDWGDYDNDGDLDIVLIGLSSTYETISNIYRNDSGVFTDIESGLIDVNRGSANWGDYDNDGDLDILLTGWLEVGNIRISRIYRNDSGVFNDINAGLAGVIGGSTSWGDYDNDGDLDIVLTGTSSTERILKIYQNDSGIFTEINLGIPGVDYGSVAWGDYDNDDDLDILLAGQTGIEIICKIYSNDSPVTNTKPFLPSNLTTSFNDSTITFSWDKATDNETPLDGLSYNFYIGTESLEEDLKTSMSDNSTGYRRVVDLGNAQQNTSYTLNKALPNGKYYWSVQAIDHAFAGSEFAPEQSFVILSTPQNVQIKHTEDYVKLTWDEVPGAQLYYIYASDDPESEFINVSKQGIFNGVSWTQTMGFEKKFYYVVAVLR